MRTGNLNHAYSLNKPVASAVVCGHWALVPSPKCLPLSPSFGPNDPITKITYHYHEGKPAHALAPLKNVGPHHMASGFFISYVISVHSFIHLIHCFPLDFVYSV
jgi:hypothetical protein